MKRILHLSDLHFGRDRPELIEPLLAKIAELAPDLVAISGDFTQRARIRQFAQAAAFKERIAAPVLAVPGNHDTPLDNLFVRLLRPWKRYRTAIDRRLEPLLCDDDAVVVGVNTVNRFSWQRGRISRHTVNRVCAGFEQAGDRLRVVVLHHPLEHGPEIDKRLMRGSSRALDLMQGCGADVVLSGHLHNTVAVPFTAARGLLFVQAGTGLSSRLRGERNTFNLLAGSRDRIEIETFEATEAPGFTASRKRTFRRGAAGWEALPEDSAGA